MCMCAYVYRYPPSCGYTRRAEVPVSASALLQLAFGDKLSHLGGLVDQWAPGICLRFALFWYYRQSPSTLGVLWVLESLSPSPRACPTDTFIHWTFPLPLWSLIFAHFRFLRYTGWHRSATRVSLDSSVFQSLPLKSVSHSLCLCIIRLSHFPTDSEKYSWLPPVKDLAQ